MAAPKSSQQKKEGLKTRTVDGKVVKPVLYNGRANGHGKYIAAEVDGKFVTDKNGKPLPFKSVGLLK